MKKLLKEFLRRGNRLLNELWNKQVSRPYPDQENAFKRKPESKIKGEIIENAGKSIYEATNISNAYEGMYWKWQRVKEYFREIEDKYCDMGMKEAKAIMNS